MVGHQYIRMNLARPIARRFFQPMQIAVIVLVCKEASLAIDAALDKMHRQIGTGVAMSVRRVRPSQRGEGRAKNIPNRALVDAVCLGQQTLGAVLKEWGWCNDGHHRKALRAALVAALDRMQG